MNPRETKLLLWLNGAKRPLLESQVVGSGLDKALNSVLAKGWADIVPHPTVKEHGVPAAGVILTDKGHIAIGGDAA